MALIKKQVFLRSRDENLQQFQAKAKSEPKSPWDDESDALDPRTKASSKDSGYGAGNKGIVGDESDTANLDQRWGQPSARDKSNTKARSKGLIRGVSEKEGDAAKKNPQSPDPRDPSGVFT